MIHLVYMFTNVVLFFFVVIKCSYKVVDMSLLIQTDPVHQGRKTYQQAEKLCWQEYKDGWLLHPPSGWEV